MQRTRDLTEGVIWEKILLFAFPIFLTNFLQQLYNAVDLVIVGQFAGKHALAAVGATGSISSMVIGLFMGLATGCSVVIAQRYGAGDYSGLYRAVHTSYMIALAGGGLLTLVGYFITPSLLMMMGTPVEILDMAIAYMRIYFVGSIPLLVYNMGAGILRSVGNTRSPFFFLAVSAVTNVTLDYLFVAIFQWGVAGAGWATFLAQLVAGILISWHLTKSDKAYRLLVKKIAFHKEALQQSLVIGLPAGLQSSVISFANVLIQSEINRFGANAIAGCAASSRLDSFIFATLEAFAIAATTFSGQNIGAKFYDRLKYGSRVAVGLVTIFALVLGGLVAVFSRNLVAVFNGHPEVVDYGSAMVMRLVPFYFILGLSQVYTGIVRGAGKSIVPMVSALVSMCVLRMAFIYLLLPYFQDIRVIFWAYPFSWLLNLMINYTYYRFGNWLPKEAALYTSEGH